MSVLPGYESEQKSIYVMNGDEFRDHVADILKNNHQNVKTEKYVGIKENGIRFKADIILRNEMIIIDSKLKNSTGTIEEKVLDKAMHIQYICDTTTHERGVIIYGGKKNNLKQMRHLEEVIPKLFPKVTVIRFEDDVELKNV
tara:strand:+ start:82 stop:507 length:426 start_codon:yes stop_codon:yes gene_type:complete